MRLVARGISKSYSLGWARSIKALDSVDIDIPEGKVVALLGEAGSGKSTFSMILAGLLKPDSGIVLYNIPDNILGQYEDLMLYKRFEEANKLISKYSIYSFSSKELKEYRIKVGYMFQEAYSYLDDYLTVDEIIKEPLISKKQNPNKASEIEKDFGIEDIKERYPSQLSDGQKQKVALARTFAYAEDLVILDEPTSNLDPVVKAQIVDLIAKMKGNKSILLITHEANVAKDLADYVYIMYSGQIIEKGPAKEIFALPRHPYSKQLISIGLKSVKYSGIVGQAPYYPFPIKGCIYHRACPISFNECGWTPEEVLYDLLRIYYTVKHKKIEGITTEGEVVLFGVDKEEISKLIENHKNAYRSLFAIDEIKAEQGLVRIKIHKYSEIPLIEVNDAYVKCLIYRKKVRF